MKLLLVGDEHWGEKGNSPKYNQQLIDFHHWLVSTFSGEVDMLIQLGDYFHHRKKIQLDTLNYAVQGAKILQDGFGKDNVIVFTGNHDMFNLSDRSTNSLITIDSHVTVVNEMTSLGDVLLVPWIVSEEEWQQVIDLSDSHRFCLAHFELNGFMVNDAYEMEHGFSPKGLKKFELVVSGHYHSPQRKDNIVYAGTPLPITMNEANEEHGVYVLDTETGDLEFFEYNAVKVISIAYHELEDILEELDPDNTSIRVEFPDELEDETVIGEVRALLDEMKFSEAKIKYRGQKAKALLESEVDDVEEVENIDEAVIGFIKNSTDVSGVDKELMLTFYRKAIELRAGDNE